MILSYTDDQIVDQLSQAMLLDGIFTICQAKTLLHVNAQSTAFSDDTNPNHDTIEICSETDWSNYYNSNNNQLYENLNNDRLLIIRNEIRRRRLTISKRLLKSNSVVVEVVHKSSSSETVDDDDVLVEYMLKLAYQKIEYPWITNSIHYNRYRIYFRDILLTRTNNDSNRSNNNNNSKSGSVSLFHTSSQQSSSVSMLNQFVTLDSIKECNDNHRPGIISALANVIYLEDLIPDWDEICELLRHELTTLICRPSTTPNVAEDSNQYGQTILDLHRCWFHKTRRNVQGTCSQDDRMIQTTLAHNLVQVVQSVELNATTGSSELISTNTQLYRQINIQLFRSCITTILDMIADWVDRNVYRHSDPIMKEIGITVWNWSVYSTSINHYYDTNHEQSITIHTIIRKHCPFGRWIYQYLTNRYMCMNEIVELISQTRSPSPISHSIAGTVKNVDAAQLENLMVYLYNISIQKWNEFIESSIPSSVLNQQFVSYVWILSCFRSIFVTTRVSHFPWEILLSLHDTSPTGLQVDQNTAKTTKLTTKVPEQSVLLIFQLYFQLLQWLMYMDNKDDTTTIDHHQTEISRDIDMIGSICIDAIEILISGCSQQHFQMKLMQEVETFISIVGENTNNNYCTDSKCKDTTRLRAMIQRMINRLHLSGIQAATS
jgi:hypothetical protein